MSTIYGSIRWNARRSLNNKIAKFRSALSLSQQEVFDRNVEQIFEQELKWRTEMLYDLYKANMRRVERGVESVDHVKRVIKHRINADYDYIFRLIIKRF